MPDTVKLTSEQKEAIAEIDRNLQIIACAGSGKTEVITRRIANIIEKKPAIIPGNIVSFTFTEKAADSMKTRIVKALDQSSASGIDSMYIGTIHGFCYHLLNKYTDQFRDYKILDTVKSHLFVARYFKECGMSALELEPHPRNIKLFLECIDKMIDDYENADAWTPEQRTVLENYIRCLYEHKYIDFSLMIFETLRQIDENPDVKAFLSEVKYLVVDEYQDVNDLQERLIYQIAASGANICVVGDDDQTIYQFRGSNADNMISFSERYPNVHQVRLEKNFRCAPGIVDIADCVIGHNKRRIPKTMVSGIPEQRSFISAVRYDGKNEQFDSIAGQIQKLHDEGIPFHEIACMAYFVGAQAREGLFDAFYKFCVDSERIGCFPCVDKAFPYDGKIGSGSRQCRPCFPVGCNEVVFWGGGRGGNQLAVAFDEPVEGKNCSSAQCRVIFGKCGCIT